jgi:threonine synthase
MPYRYPPEVGTAPQRWGFQAVGAAPIVFGEVFDEPETIVTAIRIGNPASWDGAVEVRNATGSCIEAVTDDEILAAYRFLAHKVGVFCEPASAAGVAGIMKYADDLPEGDVVCTVTGHGLKNPDTASDSIEFPGTAPQPSKQWQPPSTSSPSSSLPPPHSRLNPRVSVHQTHLVKRYVRCGEH